MTACQNGNGGMCSAFSGTTMVSPGLISTECQPTQSLRISVRRDVVWSNYDLRH
jgi:hypothetical protein